MCELAVTVSTAQAGSERSTKNLHLLAVSVLCAQARGKGVAAQRRVVIVGCPVGRNRRKPR